MAVPSLARPGERKPRHIGELVTNIVIYAFLLLLALTCLIPFYSMIVDATHTSIEIATGFWVSPGPALVSNYNRLIGIVNIWQGFLHSLYIATLSTILSLYFSALAGYGFSKYSFKGKNFLFAFVLGTMMIPGQLGIIGFFHLMSNWHLLNTYWPLILPSISSAFLIFFFRQICESSVPNELLDAARIDGAGELRIFHRIVLPLLIPGLATMGIFTFIGSWNSFLMPLIIIFDNSKQVLPVMVALTKGQFSTDYGAQYVGVVISVIPILIVFAVLSRRIIGGITVGALKG
jgi:multiple sugar transport system permease protein